MTNNDSDGLFDSEGEEQHELSWTETDWETYLAEHETVVRDYLRCYEQAAAAPDRIDEVARRMGWEIELAAENPDPSEPAAADTEENYPSADWEPYTLHRNPVHIATKALYLSLLVNWERIAVHPERVAPAISLAVQGSLYRGREHSLQAIQALDLGDYSLAVCFFKRALRELNETLAQLSHPDDSATSLLSRYRDYALPRLFDLREIWLRVMNECRQAGG